jgi:hypothetical protein
MLMPGCVAPLCSETHRLVDVELEDVEVIHQVRFLGEQTASLIPNIEDAMFTAPLELLLVELPQDDDVCGEARDVIHPLERLALPVLALEEDGVAPLDATTKLSPNFTVPQMLVSSSKKAEHTLVM